jgi:subtilisin family serine protease
MRKAVFLFVFLVGQNAWADGVLVRYRNSTGLPALTLNSRSDIVKIETDSKEVEDLVDRLNRDPEVDYAEPDFPIRPAALPDDPLISESFYHYEITELVEAWDLANDCSSVTVAVIDSGIDADHPDLEENLWFNGGEVPDNGKDDDGNGYIDDRIGYNFHDGNPVIDDGLGHGTSVAGIIGAVGNNGVGLSGVCWSVQILPLKIFGDAEGEGGALSSALRAIDYAISQGARILNLSWTLVGSEKSLFLEEAIRNAEKKGVLVVAAAGNEGLNLAETPVYPAAYDLPNVVTVAAHGYRGGLLGFSNYGEGIVDIAAPGIDVMTTGRKGKFVSFTGTSAAAPHVSGAAALLLSIDPSLAPAEIAGLLTENANLSVLKSLSALEVSANSSDGEAPAPEFETSAPAPAMGGCSLVVK